MPPLRGIFLCRNALAATFLLFAPLAAGDFWAFRPLSRPRPPHVMAPDGSRAGFGPVDMFLLAALRARGLCFAPEADRRTLIRRATLDLTGLPPSPEEVQAFLLDSAPDAYERLVERLLASPRHGERWAQQWLDAAGYSDSNGYHRDDTPRPLAYRYRDQVIRSLQRDKPYDRFILEQLAGDELVDPRCAPRLSGEEIDALTATHFLRNGPDGTDSTEGNEKVRVMERYAVLEQELHIIASALFGLTIDCARCHDHKFDPIPQRDYYAMQAILYPAFNVKSWVQPKDRWIHAAGTEEVAEWQARGREADAAAAELRGELERWVAAAKVAGTTRFEDDFSAGSLADSWSATAPGDAVEPGARTVHLDVLDPSNAPAAGIGGGRLHLLAAPAGEGVWLSTRQAFDWTPDRIGGWIQAEFEILGDSIAGSKPAERIGWYIAIHDHDDGGKVPGGNILIDGNPAGGAEVHLDYPGKDAKKLGPIGSSPYAQGQRRGVRITRVAEDEYLLAHVAGGRVEEKMLTLRGADLPDGGLGFELCCGRSFTAGRVVIASAAEAGDAGRVDEQFAAELVARRHRLDAALRAIDARRLPEPPRISWATDLSPDPPQVPLLKRGDYFQPGEMVEPGVLSALRDAGESFDVRPPFDGARTTGRRLAFARWATRPGSRAAALLARVETNRIWLGHFGRGIVETPENFGARGEPPSNPELLEWLASDLVEHGWSLKHLHRVIVLSRAYRQASAVSLETADGAAGELSDPEDRRLWHFPQRRLDAEVLRDSMLSVAGVLNLEAYGPPVDFEAREDGEVVLSAPQGPGPHAAYRRTIYIRHRRSQPLTFLAAFDRAAMDPNCVARASSTVVSQALAMLNGELAVRMGSLLAGRVARESPGRVEERIDRAFEVALARPCSPGERRLVAGFLASQTRVQIEDGGEEAKDPRIAGEKALSDFCRMLLATDEFAYIQ